MSYIGTLEWPTPAGVKSAIYNSLCKLPIQPRMFNTPSYGYCFRYYSGTRTS